MRQERKREWLTDEKVLRVLFFCFIDVSNECSKLEKFFGSWREKFLRRKVCRKLRRVGDGENKKKVRMEFSHDVVKQT